MLYDGCDELVIVFQRLDQALNSCNNTFGGWILRIFVLETLKKSVSDVFDNIFFITVAFDLANIIWTIFE